jgi:glutaredoxin-dependent peroxiredoxin
MSIQESIHPQVGAVAPEFTLFNTEKKAVALHDLRGKKAVILFFPLAFTSVCTAELCDVRDNLNRYAALDAVILGVSVDSLFSLGKFREELSLPFDLLSDFNKETSSAYGSLYPQFGFGMQGVSKRSAFVVDREGVIRYAEVLENAGEIPNLNAIIDTLATIA